MDCNRSVDHGHCVAKCRLVAGVSSACAGHVKVGYRPSTTRVRDSGVVSSGTCVVVVGCNTSKLLFVFVVTCMKGIVCWGGV